MCVLRVIDLASSQIPPGHPSPQYPGENRARNFQRGEYDVPGEDTPLLAITRCFNSIPMFLAMPQCFGKWVVVRMLALRHAHPPLPLGASPLPPPVPPTPWLSCWQHKRHKRRDPGERGAQRSSASVADWGRLTPAPTHTRADSHQGTRAGVDGAPVLDAPPREPRLRGHVLKAG